MSTTRRVGRGLAVWRRPLVWFVLRRLVATTMLMLAVVVVTFVLVHLAPGDAATTLAGQAGGGPGYLAMLREKMGLDRPLIYQIGAYLSSVARGDLGYSVIEGAPVSAVILARVPATLLLAGTSLAVAAVGGVLLGSVAAASARTPVDTALSVGSLAVYSLPTFWVGQLVLALVAVRLGWLPTGGMSSTQPLTGAAHVADVARHLVLPAATFSLLLGALTLRITRVSMLDALGADYITAARGRGLGEGRIVFHHALRAALRPVLTVITGQLGLVITGSVLIETVFSWPGLGRLLVDAILARDNAVVVGLLLFFSAAVAVANLIADIGYAVLDPRVRLE